MSERGCERCGYNLAGLPAVGTVVSCPECGHANDLAVPHPGPVYTFAPLLWAMIPMVLGVVCVILEGMLGGVSGRRAQFFFAMGLLGGAITAGVLIYRVSGHEGATGRASRRLFERLLLSVCAGTLSAIVNGGIVLLVMFVLNVLQHR